MKVINIIRILSQYVNDFDNNPYMCRRVNGCKMAIHSITSILCNVDNVHHINRIGSLCIKEPLTANYTNMQDAAFIPFTVLEILEAITEYQQRPQ